MSILPLSRCGEPNGFRYNMVRYSSILGDVELFIWHIKKNQIVHLSLQSNWHCAVAMPRLENRGFLSQARHITLARWCSTSFEGMKLKPRDTVMNDAVCVAQAPRLSI